MKRESFTWNEGEVDYLAFGTSDERTLLCFIVDPNRLANEGLGTVYAIGKSRDRVNFEYLAR